MELLAYFLLFITIIISGSTVFAFRNVNRNFLKLLLSFSGAYLFALSVLHLMPEIYRAGTDNSIGMFIFIGFFLQIIMEIMSEGIEHGHIHIHKNQNAAFPFGMMIGLCLHSFLEGMPLVQKFADESTRNSLLAGIILHHIPVAIALMSMLLQSGISRTSSFLFLLLFGIMAPAGAMVSSVLSASGGASTEIFFNRVMAIVIGIFLHISTTILFESDQGHKFNYWKLLIIFLGGLLAYVS